MYLGLADRKGLNFHGFHQISGEEDGKFLARFRSKLPQNLQKFPSEMTSGRKSARAKDFMSCVLVTTILVGYILPVF